MAKRRSSPRSKKTVARGAKKAAPRKAKTAARRIRVQAVPSGFHTLTAHLTVGDGNQAVDFYKRAFGAKEVARMPAPDGSLMHAELKIGNSMIMLAGEMPGGSKSPKSLGGSPVTLNLYVSDADDFFMRAVQAGARVTMPLANQFWGDRYGQLEDPFGHIWAVATHIENLTPQEMMKRAQAAFSAPRPQG